MIPLSRFILTIFLFLRPKANLMTLQTLLLSDDNIVECDGYIVERNMEVTFLYAEIKREFLIMLKFK